MKYWWVLLLLSLIMTLSRGVKEFYVFSRISNFHDAHFTKFWLMSWHNGRTHALSHGAMDAHKLLLSCSFWVIFHGFSMDFGC